MAPRKPKSTPPTNFDLLNAEDRAALTETAKKSVLEQLTQEQRDAYFAAEVARIRSENVPDEAIVQVFIDCAPFVNNIMLDGINYYHGYTYEVTHKRRCVLLEQMQRSWLHQDEIDGRGRLEAMRRPRDMRIGPRQANTVTQGFAPGATLNAEV